MKKNSVFAYKKVAAQITRLLRREVGPRILALRKKRRLRISTKKTYADIVTAGDKLSEQILRQYIDNQYPSHKIYGEEISAKNPSGSKFEWFIDPIDGTIPYAS
ncbi:MAG: inositol monophosphatase family protein, partial [Candidatus Liptonbacteria bacterium]|nr:inositol monophosphatase family protein [Candidatus Liptonbacteria bacterium]